MRAYCRHPHELTPSTPQESASSSDLLRSPTALARHAEFVCSATTPHRNRIPINLQERRPSPGSTTGCSRTSASLPLPNRRRKRPDRPRRPQQRRRPTLRKRPSETPSAGLSRAPASRTPRARPGLVPPLSPPLVPVRQHRRRHRRGRRGRSRRRTVSSKQRVPPWPTRASPG